MCVDFMERLPPEDYSNLHYSSMDWSLQLAHLSLAAYATTNPPSAGAVIFVPKVDFFMTVVGKDCLL